MAEERNPQLSANEIIGRFTSYTNIVFSDESHNTSHEQAKLQGLEWQWSWMRRWTSKVTVWLHKQPHFPEVRQHDTPLTIHQLEYVKCMVILIGNIAKTLYTSFILVSMIEFGQSYFVFHLLKTLIAENPKSSKSDIRCHTIWSAIRQWDLSLHQYSARVRRIYRT